MNPYIRRLVSDFNLANNTLIQKVSSVHAIHLVYKTVSFGVKFYLRMIFFLRKRAFKNTVM